MNIVLLLMIGTCIIVTCVFSGCFMHDINTMSHYRDYEKNPEKVKKRLEKYDNNYMDYRDRLNITPEQEAQNAKEVEEWAKEQGYE